MDVVVVSDVLLTVAVDMNLVDVELVLVDRITEVHLAVRHFVDQHRLVV